MEINLRGYALPLALALVAIFSIVVGSIESRSNLYNQIQVKIINNFKLINNSNQSVTINGIPIAIPDNISNQSP
jgi:hypothetical protein